MLGIFKSRDPICGMTEEKGRGIRKAGKWFCSEDCLNKYEKRNEGGASCCH